MRATSRERFLPKQHTPTWLKLLIIVVLCLGIFFRFVNLEQKVYWHDEAYTGLRISGYTKKEFVQQVFNGRVMNVESIRKYQYPNSEKGIIDTMHSLAVEDAQHPPLYYVLIRLWVQIFGNSIAVTRSLSAVISLLAFPCIYWLCLELFKSPITGWISIALLAISPFHVLYAQEARQFSLWTVTILLGSASLLRAMRLGGKRLWVIYAVTVAIGLYTFLFSGLVTLAHGIYVFVIQRFQFTKPVKAYLVAASAGFLAFVPWILVVINNLSQIDKTTASAQQRQSISALVTDWSSNISYLFGDFWRYEPFFPDLHFPGLRWGRYLVPLILILVGFSFYFIYLRTAKQVWLFIFTLFGVPALALILNDVIIGGKLSVRSRYIIPCYVGVQLAVAYLFASQILSNKALQRRFCNLVLVAVISTGVLSCAVSSQAETWWSKGSHANPQIARIINSSIKPLLISSNHSLNIGDIMSLSHLLNSKVQIQLVTKPNIPKIPNGFSEIYLYNPSKQFRTDLEKTFTIDTVYKNGELWRLKKKI
ncbi:glycosyltransferase family 39 protein [Mastigocladopsis repens]|uniref:glycosyltransferase family 39 protein n=1 Tax=Mastigocladopsis repens TaxID=221287 RepID=UPI00037C1649|nr:glycosyltransferase family 39 protein [Mastigocladopsis repens]